MKNYEVSWAQYKIAKSLKKWIAYYAIKTIQEYAKASKPIPEELLVYLDQACEAWIKERGNRVSNYDTDVIWRERVSAVHLLRKSGMKSEIAINQIAKRDRIKSSSMQTKYYSSKYKKAKEFIDMSSLMKDWDFI